MQSAEIVFATLHAYICMAAGIGLEFDVLICFGFGLVTPFPKTLVAPQVRCLCLGVWVGNKQVMPKRVWLAVCMVTKQKNYLSEWGAPNMRLDDLRTPSQTHAYWRLKSSTRVSSLFLVLSFNFVVPVVYLYLHNFFNNIVINFGVEKVKRTIIWNGFSSWVGLIVDKDKKT